LTSGVYKITNIVTGKCYIGSSINIKRRWQQHKENLGKNKHHAKHMQHSWNKYGKDAFIFEIVYECAPIKDIVLFYEQLWIDFYGFKNLYNQSPNAGSPLGRILSLETKEKIRKSCSGKKHSEEARKKMSDSRKGKPLSLKHRQALSKQRKNLSLEEKAKRASVRGKRTKQIDLKTGLVIKEWDSMEQAGKILSITNISRCCNGKRKTAGGYIWRYVDDKESK